VVAVELDEDVPVGVVVGVVVWPIGVVSGTAGSWVT
jgi:hypothetical protein